MIAHCNMHGFNKVITISQWAIKMCFELFRDGHQNACEVALRADLPNSTQTDNAPPPNPTQLAYKCLDLAQARHLKNLTNMHMKAAMQHHQSHAALCTHPCGLRLWATHTVLALIFVMVA